MEQIQKVKLAFSFSTRINKLNRKIPERIDWYKLSMSRAREFGHQVIFYGCDKMLKALDGYYDKGVDVSNEYFRLIDDLKIFIHENEPIDIVTIDGDVILNKPLVIDKSVDIVFDKYEDLSYYNFYHKQFDFFKKNNKNIENEVKYLNFNWDRACNVGVLCFNNEEVRDLFIDYYFKFHKYFFDNVLSEGDEAKARHSCVVCQYYMYCLVKSYGLKVSLTRNYGDNDYKHYIGESKWRNNPSDL